MNKVQVALIQQRTEAEIQRLEGYLQAIIKANEPSILAEESCALLKEIKAYPLPGYRQ